MYALVEAAEQEVPFIEISVQFGRDAVLGLHLDAPVVVPLKGETFALHLKIGTLSELVVVFSEHLPLGVEVDRGKCLLLLRPRVVWVLGLSLRFLHRICAVICSVVIIQ